MSGKMIGGWLAGGHFAGQAIQKKEAMDEQAEASRQAASLQKEAAKFQKSVFNQTYRDLATYRNQGSLGLAEYEKRMMEGPEEYAPSEQLNYNLGRMDKLQAAQSSASGNLGSGQSIRNRMATTQQLGMADYQQHMDRYYQGMQPFQNLASMGQSAAAMSGAAGISYSGQQVGNSATYGNTLMQGAATQQAGYQGLANMNSNMSQNIQTAISAWGK